MSGFLAVVGIIALALGAVYLAAILIATAVDAIRAPALKKAEEALDATAWLKDRVSTFKPKPYYGYGDHYDFSDYPRAASEARVAHLEDQVEALTRIVKSNEIDKKQPGKKESK